jgi:hypothetical protein
MTCEIVKIARTSTLAVVFAVALMAVCRPPSAHAQIYGPITNVSSGLCLQPLNGATAAGTPVVQAPCGLTFTDAERWTVVQANSIFVHYMNKLSGMCMDARGGAQNFTKIELWPCNTITNELWTYVESNPSTGSFATLYSDVANSYSSSHKTNYCLDVPGSQSTPDLQIQIYECNGTTAQQWY